MLNMLRRLDRIRFRGPKREDCLDLAESPNASDTECADELPLKIPRTSPRDSEELRDPVSTPTLSVPTVPSACQDSPRSSGGQVVREHGHIAVPVGWLETGTGPGPPRLAPITCPPPLQTSLVPGRPLL